MRVKLGKPKDWFGPYQLAELLMFWVPKEVDEYGFKRTADKVHNFGEWLATGSIKSEPEYKPGDTVELIKREENITFLYKFLLWIDKIRNRNGNQTKVVRIDPWDTWSMDNSLAYIILPMLKQLKATKHGAPFVEFSDVPEELRPKSTTSDSDELFSDVTDDTHFERWDWVLDEMIFAFETTAGKYQDWEDQFHTGKTDTKWIYQEDGSYEMVEGKNSTYTFDIDGYIAYKERIQNGFRLFGTYYSGLWD